jgi:putative (di)nucleoside polyphosphate hydrolase
VTLVASTRRWLRYRLPQRLIRTHSHPVCIGQKQKWFLLRSVKEDVQVNLTVTDTPEFDAWDWVSYWHPLTEVVSFKRRVYNLAMKEFARIVFSKRFQKDKPSCSKP